jgi:hypothetical protein
MRSSRSLAEEGDDVGPLGDLVLVEAAGDEPDEAGEVALLEAGAIECSLESTSIFSSFSSNRHLSSRTSASNDLTRSSRDSVYPRGNARRLSLSLVLHSKPTLAHCVQHGRTPSQRIFFERQRSQAWATRLCEVPPTLMTFMGRIPGMAAERGGKSKYGG